MSKKSTGAAKAQPASTSTEAAPARGFLRAPFQAVRIDVRDCQRHVIVRYLGMAQDLLSASCATKAMLGKSRGQHLQDEHGHEVWKQRAPSKRQPDRIMIGRSVSREVALTLPGVRDLFPRGFPDPDAPQSAAEWKQRVRRYCDMPLGVVDMLRGEAGMSYFSGGFRLQPIDVERIAAKQQRFIAELLAEIDRAPVIDTRRSGPGLRLVIDNTREDAR